MDRFLSIQRKYKSKRQEIIHSLDEKWKDIKQGHEELQEKKDSFAKENGTFEVSDSDVLNINAGGAIVRVTRGTLTQFKATRLEAIFSGRWEKHLCRDNLGRIFLDVNQACFKATVDFLNEYKISSPENRPDPPFVDLEHEQYLCSLLSAFGLSDYFSSKQYDSVILSQPCHIQALRKFLIEDGIPVGLNLLYRLTRDGMNAGSFHNRCDGAGATVTVVKTTDGYVFGGYADKSWKSAGGYIHSENTFLFGLHCHGSECPIKIRVKSGRKCDAFYCRAGYGPTFGSGHDLTLLNGNYSNVGSSYNLPSGKNNDFFVGTRNFTPSEVEVFQVAKPIQNTKSLVQESTKLEVDDVSKNIEECFKLEEEAIAEAVKELTELEGSFEHEETAVKLFCPGEESSAVNLNVSGHIVTVSKLTLSQHPDSVLFKQFADPKWQECSANVNCLLPRDWDSERVVAWVMSTKRLSSDVSEYFRDVTGGELLVMGREDIKDLGIKKPGTVALLLDSIQKLREEDEGMSAPLIEHSEHCIGKIIDHMRVKAMSSQNLVPASGPPQIRDSEKNRFQRIVEYYFPNESSSDFLS